MLKRCSKFLPVFFVLIFVCHPVQSQEAGTTKEQQEQMATYMEASKPGEEHKLLESLAGTWSQEIKIWMQPGQEPQVYKGVAVNKMILGGRFLQTDTVAGEGDMYTENLIITGFDRRHKKYTIVGFDTWGTYFVTAAGTYNEKSRTVTMYGEDEDPLMGVTQKFNMNLIIVNPNKYVTEVVFKDFRTPDEKEFKMVEITHTRK